MRKNTSAKWRPSWLNLQNKSRRELLGLLGHAIGIGYILFTLSLFFEESWWRIGYIANLRPHYTLLGIVISAGFAWTKRGRAMLWLSGLVIATYLQALPWRDAKPLRIPPYSATTPLHIAHINIDRHNETPTAVFNHFNQTEPELIFIQELSPELVPLLETGMPDYELVTSQPQTNTRGIGMLVANTADLTILESEIITISPDDERPLIATKIVHEDRRLQILSWHSARPHHEQVDTFQKITFEKLAEWSIEQQAEGWRLVIIGDFNATPWSNRFKALLHDGNLVDSRQNKRSILNSWAPSPLPLWLGLPIDHAVHSKNVYTRSRTVGSYVGSDHRPIHLTVVFTSP